jgi:hypothetical protein
MDLLGFGSNAPNVVVTRPADSRVFSGADTYGKDCSSPGAGDGTGINAGFMNGLLGQLRALIRGNGQTAALANIVTEDNSDDTMALRAIQQLIQRGQPSFGFDIGAPNHLVVNLSPPVLEYKVGMRISVGVAHDNTGAATINFNGLGNNTIIRKDNTGLQRRDLIGAGISTFEFDGSNFQLVDMPAAFSNAAEIVTSSSTLNLTLQQRAIALFRTAGVAAMTINLPAGASNGQIVIIEDVAGNLQAANATVVAPAGETIASAANFVMDRDFQSTTFRFYTDGVTRIWSRST